LTGYPVVNVRYILMDGQTHVVDSSTMAFQIATRYSFRKCFGTSTAAILEPIMNVEITCPSESYKDVMAGISKRRGLVTYTEGRSDVFLLQAKVPLSQMFGYASELRGLTSG